MALPNLGTFMTFEEFEEYKVDSQKVQLVYTETYNEHELRRTIDKIGKEILACIAIQLAIVGYGNKSYGEVEFDGVKILIEDFFRKNGIKSDLTINSKLKPSDLTPRRLIRFYRFTIDEYVKNNKDIQSYLYKKYCLQKDDNKRSFIYPGYEHIAQPGVDDDNVIELLKTYSFLDEKLGTKIKERIIRVLIARGFHENVIYNNRLI